MFLLRPRFSKSSFSTRIVSSQTDILKLFRKYYSWKPRRLYAFYNSQFDKIITQQHLMLFPIDERVATRAHAAINYLSIRNQRVIDLNHQVQKLFERAKSLAIVPCLTPETTQQKIVDTARVAFQSYLHENTREDLQKQSFTMKIMFSSGHGDFGIAARDNGAVFYANVEERQADQEEEGVREFVTRSVNCTIREYRHPRMANVAENAMMTIEAKKRGGFSGIKATSDGVLLEASAGNIAFVFPNQKLVLSKSETVSEGELTKRVLQYMNNEVKEGRWGEVIQKDVMTDEAETALEMMIIGQDKIIPVLELNEKRIGEKKGILTSQLQQWHQTHIQEGTLVEI